jgi:hypothetical protein
MDPERSLQCSEEPSFGPYANSHQFSGVSPCAFPNRFRYASLLRSKTAFLKIKYSRFNVLILILILSIFHKYLYN